METPSALPSAFADHEARLQRLERLARGLTVCVKALWAVLLPLIGGLITRYFVH